ncbi:MAG: RNA methyltransferase [Anaerolineaceae bacterium]|nr:RNA methyltransferase [Anaerolineaceae bacterium]
MITSTQNSKVRLVRTLMGKRKERQNNQAFVVEGVRLTEETLTSAWTPRFVLYSDQLSERGHQVVEAFAGQGVEVEEVAPHLMESMTGTRSPQGILAVLPLRTMSLPSDLNFVLIIDQVRDPGNLGTILRTAAAAGVQAVILAPGTTDAFAPKVVRSGMGAHFRLPVIKMTWEQLHAAHEFGELHAIPFYLADAAGETDCWDLDWRSPVGLIVGGEADGAGSQAHQLAAALVRIPMPGSIESLNAAAAASVLLFEVVRQRNS